MAPGRGLGGLEFVVHCILKDSSETFSFDALLGRLLVLDRLLCDFATDFILRRRAPSQQQTPNGNGNGGQPSQPQPQPPTQAAAAVGSPLLQQRASGASPRGFSQLYENYERLLSVISFAQSACSSSQERIGSAARRLFVLAARLAVHESDVYSQIVARVENIAIPELRGKLHRRLVALQRECSVALQVARTALSMQFTIANQPLERMRTGRFRGQSFTCFAGLVLVHVAILQQSINSSYS